MRAVQNKTFVGVCLGSGLTQRGSVGILLSGVSNSDGAEGETALGSFALRSELTRRVSFNILINTRFLARR
jgi:hypothetical protein